MKRNTEKFLKLINDQAERVQAMEQKKAPTQGVGLDPIRVKREQERREQLGELRAREKSGKRPTRARKVFPHIDLS